MPPFSAPDLDAVVAVLRTAGCVFAEDEARLLTTEARTPTELAAMVERRVAGHPLEHVLGWARFCGLRVACCEDLDATVVISSQDTAHRKPGCPATERGSRRSSPS